MYGLAAAALQLDHTEAANGPPSLCHVETVAVDVFDCHQGPPLVPNPHRPPAGDTDVRRRGGAFPLWDIEPAELGPTYYSP